MTVTSKQSLASKGLKLLMEISGLKPRCSSEERRWKFSSTEEHPWKSVYDLLKIEGKVGSTVQNQLTKYRFTKFRNAIEGDIRNESIHWFTWHKGHGGDSQAGHWLNMIPKYQKFYMDPLDFRTAIRHYMFFKVDKFVGVF